MGPMAGTMKSAALYCMYAVMNVTLANDDNASSPLSFAFGSRFSERVRAIYPFPTHTGVEKDKSDRPFERRRFPEPLGDESVMSSPTSRFKMSKLNAIKDSPGEGRGIVAMRAIATRTNIMKDHAALTLRNLDLASGAPSSA